MLQSSAPISINGFNYYRQLDAVFFTFQEVELFEDYAPLHDNFITKVVMKSFQNLSDVFASQLLPLNCEQFGRAANIVILARRAKWPIPHVLKARQDLENKLLAYQMSIAMSDQLCHSAYLNLWANFLAQPIAENLNELNEIMKVSTQVERRKFLAIAKIVFVALQSYSVLSEPLKEHVIQLQKNMEREIEWIKVSDFYDLYQHLRKQYLDPSSWEQNKKLVELPKSCISQQLEQIINPELKLDGWECIKDQTVKIEGDTWEYVDVEDQCVQIEGLEWDFISSL